MLYRVIGLMSGSSLDGLDIIFAEFNEQGGHWTVETGPAACYAYTEEWSQRLQNAKNLSAIEYCRLHIDYGHYLGNAVNRFIDECGLQYKVAVIASHGHTVFHEPSHKMTAQLGDGASIAAETKLPVVADLRSMDMAFGGQGAPIVPIGEKMLFGDVEFFLNIGGICNISQHNATTIAFDICPANRVLNMLANDAGLAFDDGGKLAATGSVDKPLLDALNALAYYHLPYPKSLGNEFGTEIIYPMIKEKGLTVPDSLRTYCEHIAQQCGRSLASLRNAATGPAKMIVTGGGALNDFLTGLLKTEFEKQYTELVIPEKNMVLFKEALIMAFIGVLRWREEYNVLSSVTGAARNSIGGSLWLGQEA
jgi:anhydro-N-acetylmuramic acid kinase